MSKNFVSYAQVLAVGLAYFILAFASIYLSRGAGTVAHFWYANAIGVAFLLQFNQNKRWQLAIVLAIANFLANWVLDNSWWLSLAFVLPNALEMLVATWLAKSHHLAQDFDRSPRKMLRFVALVSLLPSGVGAIFGASILGFFGFAQFWQVLPLWFISSSVGSLSLLPLLLLFQREYADRGLQFAEKRSLFFYAFVVCLGSFICLRYLPFSFIYLAIPLIFSAVATDTKTVSLLIFLQSLVIGIMIHTGLFVHPVEAVSALNFLNYLPILATFVPILILTASMNLFRSQDRKKREIEDELQQKHAEIQMVIDNVPALIGFWDTNLRNRFANRGYYNFFGWKPEDILGRHVSEVVGEKLHAQNLPYLQAALRGEAQMFERTITDHQGNVRENLASYMPSYRDGEIDGVYAFVSDITDIKKAQRAESFAQERLQSVIDSATEFSIISTDTQGTVTLFSRGAEKLLGYTGAEFVNQQSPAVLHVAEEVQQRGKELSAELNRVVEGFEVFVAKANLGINETREWTYVHKTGRTIPVRLVVTAIYDGDKKIVGYLGIANDISDEKELQTLLISAKDSAEKMSQAKSDFVANMSHEIRTPMNAVLGMSQLLAATNLSSEQRKYLDMIKISGQSLMGVLNDILDFSKLEAHRLELSNIEFSLDDVLGALASMMAVTAVDKDIELAIGVDVGVPKRLIGDQLRLQQILTNLTGNALKFTSRGEVAVFVDRVVENATENTNKIKLRITVRDTGIGMDQRQMQRLFQPFSQADASTTRQFGGTGLGLSISKSILTLMGGEIEVRSQLGQGSEFQITIPMEIADSTVADQDRKNQKRMNLLVVDDNLTSNSYICRTIRSWNWSAESASNGQQALEIVRAGIANQQHFDAIIVDWQMPMMDGLVTIKSLREILPKARTPLIIMVSAFSRDRMLQGMSHVDASEYADAILMKPMTGSSIFDTVHESIALCSGEETIPRYNQAALTRAKQIQGAKLLLVEDNPFNQIVAKGFLEQGGASVEILENGYLAVEHLRSHASDYHAVLMDVQMPIMDGISATRMIRNELQLSIPIIAMTAGVMYSERERCNQSGMNDFIAKPIDVEQMFAVIAQYLPADLIASVKAEQTQLEVESSLATVDADLSFFNAEPFEKLAQAAPASLARIVLSIKGVVEQANPQLVNARQALIEGRLADVARILHTMRGSVGTLGAKSFAAITLQIEALIHDGAIVEIEPLLKRAELDLQRTISLARTWLEKHAEKSNLPTIASTTAQKPPLDRVKLAQLKDLLKVNNMAACDVFQALGPAMHEHTSLAVMAKLEDAIYQLDFKTALTLLEEFA